MEELLNLAVIETHLFALNNGDTDQDGFQIAGLARFPTHYQGTLKLVA
tara:strand:+ start:330 stop:473 length:144 start_codon:yes stop_codon:yes gene_type:complete